MNRFFERYTGLIAPGVAWAALGLLCVLPTIAALTPLAWSPRETLGEAAALAGSGRLWGLWARTLGIALGGAALATLIGAPLGYGLARMRGRAYGLAGLFLTVPLLLPPHFHAVAWIDILGERGLLNNGLARLGLAGHPFPLYSGAGVVLLGALNFYPLPLWSAWHAARQTDPALLEAARNLGAGPLARWRLILPLHGAALVPGAALVFVLLLLGFSVPSLLQTPVFTVEIFTRYNSFLDNRQAVLLALPLVATGGATLWLARRAWRGVAAWPSPEGHGGAPEHRSRQTTRGALAAIGVTMAITTILPLMALLARSLPPASLGEAWLTGWQEILTSLVTAVTVSTLLIGVTLPLAAVKGVAGRAAGWCGAGAWLLSGPVFGVGLISVWNRPGLPGWIYDHYPILVLATAGRIAFVAWIGSRAALAWWPRERAEAARTLGAARGLVWRAVVWPALRGPFCAVWAIVTVLALGEVETIALVAPPGWVPVSLRIFTLLHYGPAQVVSALALIQAVTALGLLGVAGWVVTGRIKGEG